MTNVSSVGRQKVALIQFPGSNCDADCVDAFKRLFGIDLALVWHEQVELPKVDGVILPGGFSYGDYLRGGALASCSKIMPAIKSFAHAGGAILGICNGFQVLTESKLLPGILMKNAGQKFICEYSHLAVGEGSSTYHKRLSGQVLKVPIAHGEGRYYVPSDELTRLKDNGQVLFRYASTDGRPSAQSNPNGASDNIAGIVSTNGKILGMMPHPERASDPLLGSSDGRMILEAFLATIG